MRMLESTRTGSLRPPLPGTLHHPAMAQDRCDSRDRLRSTGGFPPRPPCLKTWLFHKAIVLSPLKEMAPGKGNFLLKLCRSHFSSLFTLFSEVASPCIPSISGKNSSESGGRWEACGQRQSGLAWAARGAPRLPHVGLRNSGGPGEAWKTELLHQPSFERWLEEREEGPPSGLPLTPPAS